MMRYRLRTLLIAVAIAGFCFGCVAYARQQATFHRQRASAIAHKIAQTVRIFSDGHAMNQIQSFAAGRSVTTITYHEAPQWDRFHRGPYAVIKNGPNERVVTVETAVEWRDAIDHAMLADAYDRATYRPWVLLGIKSSGR